MLNVLNKFTTHYRNTLSRSYTIASELGQGKILIEHLLQALLEEKGSVAHEVLIKTKLPNPEAAGSPKPESSAKEEAGSGVSSEVISIIEKSVLLASKLEHQYVGSEHLLYSLIENSGDKINSFVRGVKFDMVGLQLVLGQVLRGASRFPELSGEEEEELTEEEAGALKTREKKMRRRKKPKTQALDFFALNLTSKKHEQKIDPVIGREREIARMIQILGRRTKNNPMLLGEPGVGKTAIVEGLAKKIVAGDVPDQLLNKKVYSLDLSMVVAGSIYRGEFEQRLKQVIEEVKADPDILLFIDEIHTIVGAGSGGSALDAANILKPALARGEIRCIGATTFEEYKKHIESDPALERRFQPVQVRELSVEETVQVLKGIRSVYESHHHVVISDEALEASASLSNRYLPEKRLPDKAIDLIDEAASRSAVIHGQDVRVRELRELERSFSQIQEQKQEAVARERFPEALELKKQEEENAARQEELRLSMGETSRRRREKMISPEDIVAVISEITGIPIGELAADEKNRFEHLQELLEQEIFGQSDVLRDLVGYLKRARAGFAGRERSLGSFLFLGPSGVGKTETAKVLARSVFGSENRLVRLDMSEFGEAFTVSRLVGAPAGYVGYKEGGMLTEAVRRNPYSVVLFDEIEKAHPDVFNILLQVFDAGHLTDASGRKVNFRNTILILTSNIGMKSLNEVANIGFTAEKTSGGMEALEREFLEQKEEALKGIKQFFRPEFLNRLDKILVFRPLTESSLVKIAEKELGKVKESLVEQKVNLAWSEEVAEELIKEFQAAEGARVVVRNVHEKLENELADKMIAGELPAGASVSIGVREGKLFFGIGKSKARKRVVKKVKELVGNSNEILNPKP